MLKSIAIRFSNIRWACIGAACQNKFWTLTSNMKGITTGLLLILAVISATAGRDLKVELWGNSTDFLSLANISFSVELPTVHLISCKEAQLSSHLDKCLKIVFSYLKEYAGLSEKGSQDVLVGQLYDTFGIAKAKSRVSVSIEGKTYHVRDTLAYEISNSYP